MSQKKLLFMIWNVNFVNFNRTLGLVELIESKMPEYRNLSKLEESMKIAFCHSINQFLLAIQNYLPEQER
jgi:hypothetical protein